VWMGGAAPEVDASGNIWIADGNGSVTSPGGSYDHSDAVIELSPSLQIMQFFAPANWAADNASDSDLGSSSPALLPNGLVVQAGKSAIAYLLRQGTLGGIGGQLSQLAICGNDVDGGHAVSGNVVYLPCLSGVTALQTNASPPGLATVWRTTSGAGGPPIVASGLVWTISSSGELFGLAPSTGAVAQQFALGPEANHFPTPAVGDGLLLAPAARQVHAFAGAVAQPTTTLPSTLPTTVPPTSHGTTTGSSSGSDTWWIVGGVILGLAVVSGTVLLVRARRRRTTGGPPGQSPSDGTPS